MFLLNFLHFFAKLFGGVKKKMYLCTKFKFIYGIKSN